MKIYGNIFNIAFAAISACMAFSCTPKEEVEFVLDGDKIEMGAEGGTVSIKVSSPGSWIARTSEPWVTVSPANGNGTQVCQVIVDSALVLLSEEPSREAVITIQNPDLDNRTISVVQKNYGYSVTLDNDEVSIPDYITLEERHFDVKVTSNVKFKVNLLNADNTPSDDVWVTADEENPELELTKGARPRNVTLRFNWDINQNSSDRTGKLVFVPVNDNGDEITVTQDQVSRMDTLLITQSSAAPKPKDLRAADSTALVAIARSLGIWSAWDTSERMERWSNVILWETGENRGRVRYARFFMFNTDDGIPYQVSWLNAAEELVFYSNENNNLREDIILGDAITELGQLKRLTLSAYGLDDGSLSDKFYTSFPELEFLDLSSNNFSKIPEGINKENFPKLRVFRMTNNQRLTTYDLNNVPVKDPETFADEYGGLFRENLESEIAGSGFPARFLLWDKLDTLALTLNFLQGNLPTDTQIADYMLKKEGAATYWDAEEAQIADSTGVYGQTFFTDNNVPKVFPNLESFSINLNRFSGELSPDNHKWLFYHPKLDRWDPYVLIFNQEGTDFNGNAATFTGIPVDIDEYGEWPDYYVVYSNKIYSPTYTPPAE